MTAICGVSSPDSRFGRKDISRMLDPMSRAGHRRSFLSDGEMFLGVRSRRKTKHDFGDVFVAVDGHIYNREDLGRSTGVGEDASVERIVESLYRDGGEDALKNLEGDYLAAIWDSERSKLVVNKSLANNKNAFFVSRGGEFFFSSEMKSLFQIEDIAPRVDRTSLGNFIDYGHIPSPNTPFKGVERLPGGSTLCLRNGGLTIERHEMPSIKRIKDVNEALKRFRDSLQGAIGRRIESSDTPAVMLSGGVDSTLITSYVDSMVDAPVKTFNIGIDEDRKYADIVADHIGTEHSTRVIDGETLIESVPKALWWREYPSKDPGVSPLYHLRDLTDMDKVFWGQGAEEVVMGRADYLALRIVNSLPGGTRRDSSAGARLPPLKNRTKLHRFYNLVRSRGGVEEFKVFRQNMTETGNGSFHPELFEGESRVREAHAFEHRCRRYGWTSLVNGFLSDVFSSPDQTLASPFLAREVIRTGYSIDPGIHLRDGRPRYVLRKLLSDRAPKKIVGRGRDSWAHQTRDIVEDNYSMIIPVIDRLQEREILTEPACEFVSGQAHKLDQKLWSLFNLEIFLEIFVDERFTEEPPGIEYFI